MKKPAKQTRRDGVLQLNQYINRLMISDKGSVQRNSATLAAQEVLKLAPKLKAEEKRVIECALMRTSGHLTATAKMLGIGLTSLYRRLNVYAREVAK